MVPEVVLSVSGEILAIGSVALIVVEIWSPYLLLRIGPTKCLMTGFLLIATGSATVN